MSEAFKIWLGKYGIMGFAICAFMLYTIYDQATTNPDYVPGAWTVETFKDHTADCPCIGCRNPSSLSPVVPKKVPFRILGQNGALIYILCGFWFFDLLLCIQCTWQALWNDPDAKMVATFFWVILAILTFLIGLL